MEIIMGIAVFGLIVGIVGLLSNELTSKDRKIIIKSIFRRPNTVGYRPDALELCDKFEKVSYDKHLFYRMVFLNPMKLYDDEIIEAVKEHENVV